MKNLKYPILSAIISLSFFILAGNYVIRIGEFVNNFFPCKQEIKNSLPCFAIYDVIFMFLTIIIFIISFLLIVFRVVKYLKK